MKIWKSLLVIVLACLLAWGAFELYQKFIFSRKINSLDLISSDAVFIFETTQADQTWNELVNQPVWDRLSQFPAFQSLSAQLTTLDSLLGSNGSIAKVLRNKQVTVSYHATGADNFNLLFTINFGANPPSELLEELKSKIPANSRFQSRTYSEQEILEYLDSSNSRKWSVTVLNNVLLVSSSSFVIEEAIRFFLNDDTNQLSDKLGEQLELDSGLGRLILTSKGLAKLLSGVSADRENNLIKELTQSDNLVALELNFEANQVIFNGPIQIQPEVKFLPSVKAQWPDFENIIPNHTQSITQINLEGIYETQKLQNPAFSPISTISGEIQSKLIDRGFLDSFSGEMYFLELEPNGNQTDNLALLVKTTQPEEILAFLREFRNNLDVESSDFYRENEILFFPEEEFPAHLFQGKFTGFEQTHISFLGNILVMTNSAQGMKQLIDDYVEGNTWSRNSNDSYRKAISPSAGYSKSFFLPKIWNHWIQSSNPTWSTFLQKFEAAFLAFDVLSFQINQLPSGTEGTLTFQFTGESTPKTAEKKTFELVSGKQVTMPERVVYGPKVIKNFNDNTEDLVIQDQNHLLYVINSAGEQVYSIPLTGPVVSETFQIDFFKNGKLQLLFATADQLYAIDRLGNFLDGFPISFKDEKISGLNLVDYEQNREYRYFISTEKGNLLLLDKTGKPLEGWNPLSLGEPVIGAPFHYRVPGKGDFMVAQGKSGKVHFYNRRGEKQPGSPLDLGKDISAKIGLTVSSSPTLSGITKGGELVVGAFTGEISYRNQLEKSNRDDQFELITDQKRNSIVILSRQFNKTVVLNEKEEPLMTLPVSGETAWFGYFDFGPNQKILAVTDAEQGFGYLYDLSGNMLTNAPLESDGEIQITHQPALGQFLIRTRSGKNLFEYVIPD